MERYSTSTWRGIRKTLDCIRQGRRWSIGDGRSTSLCFDWWVGDGPLINHVSNDLPSVDREIKVESIIDENGTWDLSQLQSLLPPSKIEEVRALTSFTSIQVSHRCRWAWDNSGLH